MAIPQNVGPVLWVDLSGSDRRRMEQREPSSARRLGAEERHHHIVVERLLRITEKRGREIDDHVRVDSLHVERETFCGCVVPYDLDLADVHDERFVFLELPNEV